MAEPTPGAARLPCGGFANAAVAEAFAAGETRRVRRGDVIIEEGAEPDSVGMVRLGRVRVTKLAPNGRALTVGMLQAGQVFGVVPVLLETPYPASVVAVEDGVVLRLGADRFLAAIVGDAHMSIEVLRTCARRMQQLGDLVRDVATSDVEGRLARQLLTQAGQGRVVQLTRQELAELAGTTVESAIRTTKEWERSGLVRLSRGRIELLDVDALEQLTLR